ncbi:MAG: lipid II flippase MurJ [Trueperella sp.]|nr:lipid II flippase MurJ [Trueperella sp.]
MRNTVLGAAGLISVLTLVSRAMGLVRKLAQSWAMSDSPVATAFDSANTVPNVLFEVAAGGALAGAVIPIVSRFLAKKMAAELNQTASALITWILAVSLPLAALVALFADPIIGLVFDAKMAPEVVRLSGTLLRMFALQIPLYGLSVVFSGILQAHKKFVLPALAPLLSSLVVITVFAGYAVRVGPHISPQELTMGATLWLGWGTTAGVVAFSLPQLIPVLRLVKLRPTFRFPPGIGGLTLRLASAGLAALAAQQLAILAIMYTANTLGNVGTYAAFNYAYAVFMVPYAVLAVPIATAVFPRISQAAQDETNPHLVQLVSVSTRLVLAMGVLSAALLIVLARPAQIVIQLGLPIEGLDVALQAMAVGLIGFSLMYHGARVLYALDAGRLVIRTNTLAWGVVVLCLIGARVFHISGRVPTLMAIGLAISVGLSIGAAATIWAISSRLGRDSIRGYGRLFTVLLAAVSAASILAWLVVHRVLTSFGGGILAALLAALLGAIIIVGVGGYTLWRVDRVALLAVAGKERNAEDA